MSFFSRPCRICGRRTEPRQAYCQRCRTAGPRRSSSCRLCGRRTDGAAYCVAHSAEQERLASQPWRSSYQDRTYLHNRLRRHELAGGCCEACGVTLDAGWECDHVVPLRDGGTHAIDNLRVYCPECHRRKTTTDRRRRTKEE